MNNLKILILGFTGTKTHITGKCEILHIKYFNIKYRDAFGVMNFKTFNESINLYVNISSNLWK